MSLTVSTSKLIDTLGDALQTAESGVHLASTRGPWRDEPGNVDLLAFTSTDRYTVGHTWIPVDGHLTAAVWPCHSARTVLAVCKALKKGEEHTVDIDMVRAEPADDAKEGDDPGWVVTVRATPALVLNDADTEFQFHADAETKFPFRSVRAVLAPNGHLLRAEDEEPLPDTALTLWSAHVLSPLVAVAKRRKMQIQLFRSPWRRVQVVQIGDTWLGAAIPATPIAGEHGEAPSIEPLFAEGDSFAADLLRHGSGLVTAGADGAE